MENRIQDPNQFFLAKDDDQFGPLGLEQVMQCLRRGEFSVTDFIYNEKLDRWVHLFEFAPVREQLGERRPVDAPRALKVPVMQAVSAIVSDSQEEVRGAIEDSNSVREWYVRKGMVQHGPMTYVELVKSLQEKIVYEFDFVRREGMRDWVRIAQHEMFTSENIKQMSHSRDERQQRAFIKRQRPRTAYKAEVLVHDERQVWLGQAVEVSSGGAGLVVQNAMLNPGDVINLHFAAVEGVPSFSVVSEVVGKKFSEFVGKPNSPVFYAIRHLKIGAEAEANLQAYCTARSGIITQEK